MCATRNYSILKDLNLDDWKSYNYLMQCGCENGNIHGVDDKDDFDNLVESLNLLGLDEKQTSDVFRLLAGVLLLGNVHFDGGKDCSAVSVSFHYGPIQHTSPKTSGIPGGRFPQNR
ncbi:unnamed protein product [Caenorhabditis angaria]|uniref:Myosin motor domain-containing protein n=1 Tax=Caenorhabditis angaria TaxID=860376 RepID=A0A9P1IAV1_9PELO|nr:unnamed protein product [Caenorhabditis angaria]